MKMILVVACLGLAGCFATTGEKRAIDGGALYSYSHEDGKGKKTSLEAVSSRDAIEGRITIDPNGKTVIDVKAASPGVTKELIPSISDLNKWRPNE